MPDRIRRSTPAGTLIGVETADGGALFAGIPFAAPPVGALRFRPPQPIPDATDDVDAIAFGPAPAQAQGALGRRDPDAPRPPMSPTMQRMMAAMGRRVESSEDCLTLNVWTPELPEARPETGRGAGVAAATRNGRRSQLQRPVIVWIYGGGFENGTAAPPTTDGAALSRVTGCVVVSINYRVGVLGWGYWAGLGGEDWADSSNLGLQDQIAGLAWVRRNIAALGGDPGRITVAGKSAGAFSIGSLLSCRAPRGFSASDPVEREHPAHLPGRDRE